MYLANTKNVNNKPKYIPSSIRSTKNINFDALIIPRTVRQIYIF